MSHDHGHVRGHVTCEVYRRPFVAIVEYRLLYSLASIKGYIES